jgi:hypothetical protein
LISKCHHIDGNPDLISSLAARIRNEGLGTEISVSEDFGWMRADECSGYLSHLAHRYQLAANWTLMLHPDVQVKAKRIST